MGKLTKLLQVTPAFAYLPPSLQWVLALLDSKKTRKSRGRANPIDYRPAYIYIGSHNMSSFNSLKPLSCLDTPTTRGPYTYSHPANPSTATVCA